MATAKVEICKKQRISDGPKDDESCSAAARMSPSRALQSLEEKKMIVCSSMCFYCFDVLSAHLYDHNEPRRPGFSNESL